MCVSSDTPGIDTPGICTQQVLQRLQHALSGLASVFHMYNVFRGRLAISREEPLFPSLLIYQLVDGYKAVSQRFLLSAARIWLDFCPFRAYSDCAIHPALSGCRFERRLSGSSLLSPASLHGDEAHAFRSGMQCSGEVCLQTCPQQMRAFVNTPKVRHSAQGRTFCTPAFAD